MVVDTIEDRVLQPFGDGGFTPPGAALADLDVPGESFAPDAPLIIWWAQ
jgi:hypothetical protein